MHAPNLVALAADDFEHQAGAHIIEVLTRCLRLLMIHPRLHKARQGMPDMAKTDWLLVALSTAGDSGLSPVQVQKSMFLFWKGAEHACARDEFYHFVPYNYGPFDVAIYSDLEALEDDGLVRIFNRHATADRLYTITDAGRAAAAKIKRTDRRTVEFVESVVRWVQKKTFPELLRTIYRKWPEYKTNSVFVG